MSFTLSLAQHSQHITEVVCTQSFISSSPSIHSVGLHWKRSETWQIGGTFSQVCDCSSMWVPSALY